MDLGAMETCNGKFPCQLNIPGKYRRGGPLTAFRYFEDRGFTIQTSSFGFSVN